MMRTGHIGISPSGSLFIGLEMEIILESAVIIRVSVWVRIEIRVKVFMYMYYMFICIYIYICVCVCVYSHDVCMNACLYINVYVSMYTCYLWE